MRSPVVIFLKHINTIIKMPILYFNSQFSEHYFRKFHIQFNYNGESQQISCYRFDEQGVD